MLQFERVKLSNNILDSWIKADLNVCLIGKHGVGKSTIILSAFERHNLNFKYFSGATLDPWIDVMGIPTVKEHQDGKSYIDFILPKDLNENIEAIFVDEYNRTHKTVRNSLMELVQFKSINGRKFPKLRIIWVAVNPATDDDVYNVDEIDPAQLDRFHVIAELPTEPDLQYFLAKWPKEAKQIVDWFKQQPKSVLHFLSPRRLEYILEARAKGVNIKHLLPKDANVGELVRLLGRDSKQAEFDALIEAGDKDSLGKFMSDQSNFARFIGDLKKHGYDWLKNINPEILEAYALSDPSYAVYRKASGFDPNSTSFFKVKTDTSTKVAKK